MSQMNWTYIDDAGGLHRIGLFHGDGNRHLLVYCNDRILIIDFGVNTSKNYSFFINDELIDIAVEEKDGRFAYGLSVDEVTDTPRNRLRWQAERRQLILVILTGLLILGAVAGAVYWVFEFNG